MNRILVSLQRHARVLAIAVLAVGVTAANAQAPAGPHRPAGVPDDYPVGGALTFTNVAVYGNHFQLLSDPGWGIADTPDGLTPQCGYSMKIFDTSVELDYGTTITAAQSPTQCGYILAGQGLLPGQNWESCDGRFNLRMQTDGNLVLYFNAPNPADDVALWAANTDGKIAKEVVMQGDGNFVLYNTSDGPLWASGTSGDTGAYLRIQTDGNLVVYSSSGKALWASNTCCH
jgi:hypothetical protein